MAESASVDDKSSDTNADVNKYSPEAQKAIQEANARAEKAESERKKANDEAAAQRIRLKELDEKKLADEGKLSELNSKLTKDREDLQKQLEIETAEKERYAIQVSEIETERRKELLEKLPEDKRKNYETLDISTLGLIVKDFAALKPNGESLGNDRGSGQNGAIPAVKTQTELYELMQKNPVAYAEYMKQK